ncbi:Thioredoxin-like 4A, variant 2 [Microbotryomycetes sp. NB124-2]
MSYFLPKLESGWHVDQAILAEDDRVVIIRFGHDWDPQCMIHDETLLGVSEKVKNFAIICASSVRCARSHSSPYALATPTDTVDITKVPDFTRMYELYDPCTTMFFYRNKHILVDFGTGNNNKLNWPMEDKQELIDIIETVYRGASKGRGLVVSPKDYSTRYRY